jgi:rhodanese-related sulfurtransferase
VKITVALKLIPLEISPKEAASDYESLSESSLKPIIIDVREPWEWDIVSLPQALHLPLGRLLEEELSAPFETPLFTLCHHGVRSLKAAHWLRSKGFTHVQSIRGGIEAWASQVDPRLKRY